MERQTLRSRVLLLFLALLLPACLIGTPQATVVPTPENTLPAPEESEGKYLWLGEEAEVINVLPVLDSADAVAALVPKAGGEIRLELANGLVFTLSIPEGALLSDLAVTMTPIRSLAGVPLSDGMIAGVELEPEGTLLLAPATLRIEVPGGYRADRLTGFAYHAGGQNFHLARATGDGRTITLPLLTFSGHGAGSGTAEDIARQIQRSAADMGDDFSQRVSADDATEKFRNDAWANLKQYYALLRPLLKAAETNDKLIDQANSYYYQWRYEVETLSLMNELQKEHEILLTSLLNGLYNAYQKASERCVANQDIREGSKMLQRLAQYMSWGGERLTMDNTWPDFDQCLRYKLDLNSELTWHVGEEMKITSNAVGTATLRSRPPINFVMAVEGRGEISLTSYTVEFTGTADELNTKCTINTPETPGKLWIYGRLTGLNLNSKDPAIQTLLGINYRGLGQKMDKWKCDAGSGSIELEVPVDLPVWNAGFRLLHKHEYADIEGEYYWFGKFNFVNYKLIAQYNHRYDGSQGDSKVEEEFSIRVNAAPGAK